MARKLFQKRINEIMERFDPSEIMISSRNVNFFGQKSRGLRQIRGNGTLILTRSELYFEMWKPKRTLTIPVKNITKIETPKRFLSKSIFRPLLKVTFNGENGQEDSAAWYVRELEEWLKQLDLTNQSE